MSEPSVARVLIDSPLPQLDRLFDYEIPVPLRGHLKIGQRVRVPLRTGGRSVDAWVVELSDTTSLERELAPVLEPLGPLSVLPEASYQLARKLADRAAGNASDILRLIVPRRMVRAENAWLKARGSETKAETKISQEALLHARQIIADFPSLEQELLVTSRVSLRPHPGPFNNQLAVTKAMVLLAAEAVVTLAAGRSAVIAVPNYRDLAELHEALALFVPRQSVMVLDAQQNASQRYRQYLDLLSAVPRIVIGKRSAVYAPAFNLGLLAMWDEGDSSFQEPLSPGVHARDVCLMRHELERVPILFAAFSPSAEIERLNALSWLKEVEAIRLQRPKIILDADGVASSSQRLSSLAFKQAKEAIVDKPVLVQVARAGFAPTMLCVSCKSQARCNQCQGPLSIPQQHDQPRCRWCGEGAEKWQCQTCQGNRLVMASAGSERTAAELGRAFPGVKVVVSDASHPVMTVPDTPALVIATRGAEPRAVGGYGAVILLDGNRLLLSDDLRVAENCLRWWSAAAALATDQAPVHLLGVSGGIAQAFASWSQPRYVRAELADRRVLRMPPMVRLAQITGTATEIDGAIAAVRTAVPELTSNAVLGPFALEKPSEGQEQLFRALIRFDYGLGEQIATVLRAAVVSASLRSKSRKKPGQISGERSSYRRTAVPLRVRFDVAEMEL